MSAIVANQLVKHFSPEIKAVDGIDLDIPEGQIFGFLGQNGSGKTTTVRMLTTLLRPTSGSARVAGIDVFADPAAVRKKIGVALQEVGLDDLQTGRELLSLQARLFGVSSAETKKRIDGLLEVVSMSDAADRAIKGYSGGMRRRLDLACALVRCAERKPALDVPAVTLRPMVNADPQANRSNQQGVRQRHDGLIVVLRREWTSLRPARNELSSEVSRLGVTSTVRLGRPTQRRYER